MWRRLLADLADLLVVFFELLLAILQLVMFVVSGGNSSWLGDE